jgi:intein/homing endonuclease
MPSKIKFTRKNINAIKIDYQKNLLSSKKIGEKYNVSLDTILRLLNNEGIEIRNSSDSHKKYSIDENYFERIDAEDKAYFLGLMYADGYNNEQKGEAKITLQSGDTEILNVFREKLQTNKPLRIDRVYRILALENKKISKDLARHGCVQAKTFKLKFPKLRKDLIRHFIRGYFDGDGSITNSGKYPHFSIVSTKSFLTSIQNIFIKELGLSKTKFTIRHPERKHNIRSLWYGSYGNCILIYNYLYDDSSVFMKRKKIKFEKLLKPYGLQ